ncbi:MAG: DJ-1/PfpI family protein [Fibromonadales bacterium]|nr:DJ-1/PfpI family protein [Fibromonadales bacterium]
MSTVLFLLADGFEELEFIAPYDILHRGGVDVKTASISGKCEVVGAHGLKIITENIVDFDMLVLPGGGVGTENLLKSDLVKELLIKSYADGKKIAAICAAPKVLANAGILASHEATSYPGARADVEPFCKKYLDASVVISENIITSRSAGTAAEFGFCLLSLMAGFEISDSVKRKMFF